MMNYLEKKKKALMNYVQSQEPTVTVNIENTDTANSRITVTYDGVSTTYSYLQLLNSPIIIGCVIIEYTGNGGYGWKIWACGEVELNGQNYHKGNLVANSPYNTYFNYDFVGTPLDTTNKTFAFVSLGNNQTTYLMINDSNGLKDRRFADYLDKTVTYDLVDVTYNITDRWKFTANAPLKYNGATYQVGDVVDRINYVNDYDMRIFEPI